MDIDWEIIQTALREGIMVKKRGRELASNGRTFLIWHPDLCRFVLGYGKSSSAGFVFLKDYGKLWRLKAHGE